MITQGPIPNGKYQLIPIGGRPQPKLALPPPETKAGPAARIYARGYDAGQAARLAEIHAADNHALRAQAHSLALDHRIINALHYLRNTWRTMGSAGQPDLPTVLADLTDILAPQ